MFPNLVKPNQTITASWANDVVLTLRSLNKGIGKKYFNIGGGGGGGSTCVGFSKLVMTDDTTPVKAIEGGVIYCGDKNFNVLPFPIGTTNGTFLVYITINAESNTDDDGEIFLPGIKTSSATSIDASKWTMATLETYPDNDLPSPSSPTANIILPIGTLVIADGSGSLNAVGCGNFSINQCGGTLSFSRA